MGKERVLITVKTYPTLSRKYGETVCTAAVREDGSWVRIYPCRSAGSARPSNTRSAAVTRQRRSPEAEGYSSVVTEIESNSDHRKYSLERSLRGGEVLCKTDGQPDRVLAARHQGGKEDSVSQFLLDLSGLGTKKARINELGKTRPLSFRDIARLVIIDEETVIKEDSPVLSGQFTSRTVESGVFRLLLTGIDDSSFIVKEDPKVAKGRQAGKVELLEGLLKAIRDRLAELRSAGRSITRAAFNLALLRLCIQDERPFPNFVLIDSPLLVYEEPDANESSFPQDIKKHFWESVKTSFAEAQTIIIENSHQIPVDGTLAGANVVLFTGNEQGRRGFIPQAGAAR